MVKFAVNINVTACLVPKGMAQSCVEITTIDIYETDQESLIISARSGTRYSGCTAWRDEQ
jgi:hypothetical protein